MCPRQRQATRQAEAVGRRRGAAALRPPRPGDPDGSPLIIGDDVLVTNAARVERAAAAGVCNAALIKVNQVGTVSEAKAALDAALSHDWGAIVSARSGESEDVAIAHLSTGWNAGQLKVGSFTRSERMAKWNEVLRIEEAMGGDAVYAGASAFAAPIREHLA